MNFQLDYFLLNLFFFYNLGRQVKQANVFFL
jgi:hypothetical protein